MKFSKGKKEVTYVFFLFLISKVFGYFNLLVFANLYLQVEYGAVAFAFSIFNILLFVTCLGLPDTLVPWIMKKKDSSSVFYFLFMINIAVLAGGIFVSLYNPWVLPFVILMPFMLVDHTARAILKSRYSYHISQIASNIYVALLLILAVLFKDLHRVGLALAFSIAYFIPIIYLFVKTRKEMRSIISKFSIDFAAVKEYIKKGTSTAVITASFAFLTWIDSSILGALSTFENVARYSIAGAIANVVASVPLSVMHFTLTRSASIRSEKKSRLVFERTSRISYFFSLMFALMINSLIFLITRLFFPKYIGIEIFVVILSSGLVFYSVYNLTTAFLIGRMKQERTIKPIITATFLNIVLDILLIPKFGLYGITSATAFSHLVALVMVSSKVSMKNILKIIFISPILIFLSYRLGFYGLFVIPLSIPLLIYAGLITRDDISVAIDTGKRIFRKS